MTLAFEQHHFNLDAIWSAPCIDVHPIIHRSPLLISEKEYRAFLFFPSFTFLLLFFLICFVFSSLCQRLVLRTLIFSQRERESPKPSREGVVRWCWVNFQCRGVPLIWIIVELAVGAGWVVLRFFFSRLSFLFSFSHSER